ncbi:hypothetical protein [Actinoplanes sp. NPDC049316]|uniref:hypothetical protein n=1 Tax=Actinoplanes sp. NPDC049316 TaxID=3154727 RepID=UPI0034179EE0
MRKRFYAGAVLGGLLLLGTTPAYADDLPLPVGGLTGLLSSSPVSSSPLSSSPVSSSPADGGSGLSLENPLGGGPLVGVRPGDNTPSLTAPEDVPPAQPTQVPAAPLPGRPPLDAGPAPHESGLFTGGLPLLGGLGGLLPVDDAPDGASGLPAGGTPVADDDPRLHEEPAGDERAFSDSGRPIAGEDVDFP